MRARTNRLRALAPVPVALTIAACILCVPQHAIAQSAPAARATQHAIDELANCHAQHRLECPTDVPTSTSTPIPTATPIVTPTLAPTAYEISAELPTATPTPCWLTDVTWGDPDNGYAVFVPNDDDTAYVPIVIPCDSTPTPTPEPIDTSPLDTPAPIPTRRPLPPLAPVRQVAPAAPATPRVVYIQMPADTLTLTPTPTATSTLTATPTRTLVAGVGLFLNPSTGSYQRLVNVPPPAPTRVAPTATPQPTPQPTPEAQPVREISWTLFLAIVGCLALGASAGYGMYRWQRKRYRAQLAALESDAA